MKKSLILVCSAVLFIGAAAWAEEDHPGYRAPYSSYYGRDHNLTQDQHKRLADLKATYEAEIRSIDKRIAQEKLELKRLSSVRPPNTRAIERVRKNIARLQKKRSDVAADYRNKVERVLSDNRPKANPYASYGPGTRPYGGGDGYGYGYTPGRTMGGWGPVWGRGMTDDRDRDWRR